jgi:hypothetical protein
VRRIAATSALALLGFTAVAALASCGGGTETITVTTESTVTEVVTETVEAAPSDDETVTDDTGTSGSAQGRTERRFGQTGIDDGVAFVVHGWRVVSTIPQGEFTDPAPAGAGAKWVLVDLSFTNKGQTGVDPFCGSDGATLIDAQDRNFEFDGETAIPYPGNEICDELQPGFKRKLTLPFKLPKSAEQAAIALWNSSDGDYGGESSYVVFSP